MQIAGLLRNRPPPFPVNFALILPMFLSIFCFLKKKKEKIENRKIPNQNRGKKKYDDERIEGKKVFSIREVEGEKKKENTKNERKVFEKCGKTKLLRIRGGGAFSFFLIFSFLREKQEASPLRRNSNSPKGEGSGPVVFVVADPLKRIRHPFY